MRFGLPIALGLSLAACAARAPVAPSHTTTMPTTTTTTTHGARGVDEPVTLPHEVVDGATGAPLSGEALAARLRAARVIFVGEEHTNPHHHAAEREILEAAYAADPSIGVGLEMLPRSKQAALDEYVRAGSTVDDESFRRAAAWKESWGFSFGFYRPLLAFCRAHGLPAYALNAERALVRAVGRRGVEGLTNDERRALPEMRPGPPSHREMVREAFGAHGDARFRDRAFERFYQAQLVWDETMAESIVAALRAANAPRRLVVFAGERHTRRDAIPPRVARRGVGEILIVLPVAAAEKEAAIADRAGDILWVLSDRPSG
jgi:uncharacterized iron-regulated protein